MDVELTDEERALLQAACQVVLKIDFLNKNERREWYDSMVDVIECHIIMSATTSESKVCYYVLLGDLHRDFSEFANGLERTELAEDALVAYEMGAKIAKSDLKPTNIFRLEIALNYSVGFRNLHISLIIIQIIIFLKSLCIEINGLGNRAVRIAQDAIDDIANDKTLSDEELKSAENFMSILKDSLVDWKEMLGLGFCFICYELLDTQYVFAYIFRCCG